MNTKSSDNQQTTYRDRKSGKRRDLEKEAQIEMEKQEAQNKINAKYSTWSKG